MKNKKSIICMGLALGMIIPGALVFTACGNGDTSLRTMEMSVNPGVTFVVDANDKIVSVSYDNEETNIIYANVNFVGKNVNEVATLFVQYATISGHIGLQLSGQINDFTIKVGGENENAVNKLKESAKKAVEDTYRSLGLTVNVDATVDATLQTTLIDKVCSLYKEYDVQECAQKSVDELIKLVNDKQKEYEGLTYDLIEEVQNQVTANWNSSFQILIESAKTQLNNAKENLEEYKTELKNLKESYESSKNLGALVPPVVLESIENEIKATEQLIKDAEKTIEEAETVLDGYIDTFRLYEKQIVENVKEQIETSKNEMKDIFKREVNSACVTLNQWMDNAKARGDITEAQYNNWKNLINSYIGVE